MHFVDFFAGAGGLSKGLQDAGHRLAGVVEKDAMSIETHTYNHGAVHGGAKVSPLDVVKDKKRIHYLLSMAKPDMVVGGPPCQGFSAAGKRAGDDPRNSLPLEYIDYATSILPKIIMMENVEGMMQRSSKANGDELEVQVLDAVQERLEGVDYEVSHRVLQADQFGVPQTRRRLFLLASRPDVAVSHPGFWREVEANGRGIRRHLWGEKKPNVGDALSDLCGTRRVPCPDAPRFETYLYGDAEGRFQEVVRAGSTGIPQSHRLANHGPVVVGRFKAIMEAGLRGRVPKEFLRNLGEFSTSKHKVHWLDPEEPSTTISSQPGDFLHPWEPRELTVREMARLQGFPDDYSFLGRYTINGPRRPFDTARCSQVGNAVPPQLGKAIGCALSSLLEEEPEPVRLIA